MKISNKFLYIFLIVLFFVPITAFATAPYYVGLTISSLSAPGCESSDPISSPNSCSAGLGGTDSYWRFPWSFNYSTGGAKYASTLTIKNGSTILPAISGSNPANIPALTGAGDTIWSGLVNLTSGTTYQAVIDIPEPSSNFPYCPGIFDPGYSICWVSWQTDTDCIDTCGHFNLTPRLYSSSSAYGYNYQSTTSAPSCIIESLLMQDSCSACNSGASYDYYNPSTKECWYSQTNYQTADSRGSFSIGSNYVRVCSCNVYSLTSTTSLSFSFTPSF